MSNKLTRSRTGRVITAAVGITTGLAMAGGAFVSSATAQSLSESQISSILNLLSSFGADQGTINDVESALRGEPTSGGGSGSGSMACDYTFTQNFSTGATGAEVQDLQEFLNMDSDTQLAASGPGSPGNETTYFGPITASAVSKFQNKYASEVLTPVGLTSGTGYWGPSSRAKANSLCAAMGDGDGDTGDNGDTTPSGDNVLTVSKAADQPTTGALAPQSAARVPFTYFTVTAGDEDVTIDSVTVKRGGSASDGAFSGIVILDEEGAQIGDSQSLNSQHRATIKEEVTVEAGETRVLGIGGNMASSLGSYAGETPVLSIVGIDADADVEGSLPISGAARTVNATLSIGAVNGQQGSLDPGTTLTKEVGTQGVTFSGVRFTNTGSNEDVTLSYIRWEQTGSVSASDLDNLVTIIDGTEYDMEVESDGDHYMASFPGGIELDEGQSLEASVDGDITGGAGRNVEFEIEKATDVGIVGNDYGYGITPGDGGNRVQTGSQPYFDGYQHSLTGGALTVTATNDVPAGNVVNGGDDVNLASFEFDIDGESITWDSVNFNITTAGTATTGDEAINNMTLVDENGNVLAGPSDANSNITNVSFGDTVTLDEGENVLYVKGDLDNDWENNTTIKLSFTPSSDISGAEGEDSNNSITASPSSSLSGKTQTVKSGSLSVSPGTTLASQNIINNSSDEVVGRLIFDATNSGENLRVRTASIDLQVGSDAAADELSSLRLIDSDGNELMDGSDYVDPSNSTVNTDETLTFQLADNGLIVDKGSSVVIDIVGNVSATGTPTSNDTFQFQPDNDANNWNVTGIQTVNTISPSFSQSGEAVMTVVDSGTLTASVDSSDPSERWYVSGDQGTVGVFELSATNEDMELTDIELALTQASSSASDIQSISLWDGTTKITEKQSPNFGSNAEYFDVSGASNAFQIDKNDDKNLTVKVKFAGVGVSETGQSGSLVQVSTTTNSNNNKGRGLSSGSTATLQGNVASTTGARYFKSLPTVAKGGSGCSVSSTPSPGTRTLYCFTVTADDADDIAVNRFTLDVATTTGIAVDTFKLIEVDSGKRVEELANLGGGTTATFTVGNGTSDFTQSYIEVAAGETKTFRLTGSVSDTDSSTDGSITTTLLEDSAYPALASGNFMASASTIQGDSNNNFIWSPLSTTTDVNTNDWTNGFRVPGIEFDDLGSETLSE